MDNETGVPSLDVARMLAELRASYLGELPSRLDEIEMSTLEMSRGVSVTENFQALFRNVHSMKGSAGTHGLQIVTRVCHVFEDSIVKVEGDLSLIDAERTGLWLNYIDLLRTTVGLLQSVEEDFTGVELALDALCAREDDGGSVLLVASAGAHRQMCQHVLAEWPLVLTVCESGYEALGMLLNKPFDFVVTNMELPELNGLAFLSALRLSNHPNRNIPALLLTSKSLDAGDTSGAGDQVILKDGNMVENLRIALKKLMAAT